MQGERTVGGLRCGEVLARLSDYLAEALPAVERQQVEAHVTGCSVCERFGGEFALTLRRLREHLNPRVEGEGAASEGAALERICDALDLLRQR